MHLVQYGAHCFPIVWYERAGALQWKPIESGVLVRETDDARERIDDPTNVTLCISYAASLPTFQANSALALSSACSQRSSQRSDCQKRCQQCSRSAQCPPPLPLRAEQSEGGCHRAIHSRLRNAFVSEDKFASAPFGGSQLPCGERSIRNSTSFVGGIVLYRTTPAEVNSSLMLPPCGDEVEATVFKRTILF